MLLRLTAPGRDSLAFYLTVVQCCYFGTPYVRVQVLYAHQGVKHARASENECGCIQQDTRDD